MFKLNSDLHECLTEEVVHRLERHKIRSLLSFLEATPQFLANASRLEYQVILNIRKKFYQRFASRINTGFDIISELYNCHCICPTGIESLDCMLDGGFYTGHLYELCGLSGSGKTQLCLTTMANISSQASVRLLYIDTKRDFSAQRFTSLLKSKNMDVETIAKVLKLTEIFHCRTAYDILNTIHSIKNDPAIRLIVIDSLIATFFQINSSQERLAVMSAIANVCKFVADQFKLVVLMTNLWMEWKSTGVEDSEGHAGMGKSWENVPSTRLLITSGDTNGASVKLIASKNCSISTQKEVFIKITEAGVIESKN